MKKIFLLRHSIPQKGNMPNEQIPLSEKGRALAISKRNIFANVDKCFSSPYRRARETAELIAGQPIVVEDLHERTIGEAREDFWLKQYEDYDFHNPGGESLNQTKIRMRAATDGRRRNSPRGFSCNGDLCLFAFLLRDRSERCGEQSKKNILSWKRDPERQISADRRF